MGDLGSEFENLKLQVESIGKKQYEIMSAMNNDKSGMN